ncbi:DinB family protein [Macrococcoides caseolyticum]|uniref:DinB family protein n=1 Tax=Macrococcoides caseolyticum TaxID=69966 RepID=UPI001F347494|nr:DinB family protein [Macrococcus caseolyticus]MCE4955926.1 DinB family protein [Macrococcus caseolyticus]
MFRNKQDFLTHYRQEANTTIACLKELTDESLAQAVSELDRTLGEIAWHVVQSVGGFANQAGIQVEGVTFGSPQPETIAEFVEAAETIYENTLTAYETELTDEALKDDVDFFGTHMPKGQLLYAMITHQTHHRGQMTVLMRQADLKVPPIYGPSRDSE